MSNKDLSQKKVMSLKKDLLTLLGQFKGIPVHDAEWYAELQAKIDRGTIPEKATIPEEDSKLEENGKLQTCLFIGKLLTAMPTIEKNSDNEKPLDQFAKKHDLYKVIDVAMAKQQIKRKI